MKEKNEIDAEKIFQLKLFEKRINELQQQIQVIEEKINEIEYLKNGLDEIENSNDKEILSQIGPGIFVKTKLIENKKVFVDIGSKNICEKSIEEAKEFLTRQIKKIRDVREELVEEIEKIIKNLQEGKF
ncbi:prefoldin subunit alpha [Candidatus Pacearchaeota archaeon CG_4_9_14_3_um_filter_31_7]|nr:MAG: prefoldin subunit alpha [Candidatus Pacearchaeota archaeon CG1_02_31_27]PIN92382.1 MAG: prefoldin subunit alpha [Candidatus Pacearchaeota archaeon CG10_big_fil_rev_8_21_14_0_10_31_59]PIZ80685.1 MAG: prefoldin subunit alpha [Candidatus Pacearchaeota archaeon CG_4_10_14_0_2_um_filter_31_10]PJA70945.1 MAG: prefoldin subunit alpha [Candidatus Pacearchaeota archaeon CG_4_9_14_3_um_filter_31_7]